MLSALFTEAFQPFTIAALIMLGILALELASLAMGNPLSGVVDGLFDHDLGGPHGEAPGEGGGVLATALDWLNPGRVPLLVILVIALAAFAAIGIFAQSILRALLLPLPGGIAALLVFPFIFPVTRWSTRLVAKVVPRDESYALEGQDFVGMTGTITVGPARKGVVARARLLDAHGNAHFPRVEPFDANETYAEGTSVMVVEVRSHVLAVSQADPRLQKAADRS
jgi:hypothetical protein